MRNELDGETSPYLLQHHANPVHWQAWSEAVLARAKAEDRPILLSIGYAACHWCHVMAHESFENAEIAGLMNELFVNVKVDREERPDLDAIYQNALALLGQQGGWPLTMFLTPAGEPFWGGTYFPPESRYGRPGFPEVLRRVSESYHQSRETVERNTEALMQGLRQLAAPKAEAVPLELGLLDEVAAQLMHQVDPFLGGIGGAPKFPQVPSFTLLWRAYLRTGEDSYQRAVTTTLDQMCEGGIYDHLGGGFARYATDERWLAPHFEKMLYDNAQLIELLGLVWQESGAPLYRRRVEETVRWVLDEMIAPEGGFAATLDADSEGEEGKFYVWSEAEIDRLLGARAPAFKAVYDVGPRGNWEGKVILNRSRLLGLGEPVDETALAADRAVLLAARAKRIRPGWDDKVLADWNGLMIAAMAGAARSFERPDWLAAAVAAFDFVITHMADGARLWHSYRVSKLRQAGMLDDYAAMARGALVLYEATGEARYLDYARGWVAVLDQHFWDSSAGGYFFTAADAPDLITRQRHCADNATPAGNAVITEVLTRLWHLSGESAYAERAEAVFQAFSGDLRRNYFPLTTYLNNLETALRPVQIVIVGEAESRARAALAAVVHATSLPGRILQVTAPDVELPPGHPAHAKSMVDGKPAAYVCVGETCTLPLTTPEALKAALSVARAG